MKVKHFFTWNIWGDKNKAKDPKPTEGFNLTHWIPGPKHVKQGLIFGLLTEFIWISSFCYWNSDMAILITQT